MPKTDRKNQIIFAGTSPTGQIRQFGSLAEGTPLSTTDPEVIQALSARYGNGWASAAVTSGEGNIVPALEDFNALFYLTTYQLAYLFEQGIPEWYSLTNYFTDSIVRIGETLYISLTDDNLNNNPATDTVNWKVFYLNTSFYKEAAGSAADVYILESEDYQPKINEYKDGDTFVFRVVNANTGASTVNIDGVGVKNIKNSGVALEQGLLTVGSLSTIVFDSANDEFQLKDENNKLIDVVDRKEYAVNNTSFNTTSYIDITPETLSFVNPSLWPQSSITNGLYNVYLNFSMNGGASAGDGFNLKIIDDNSDTTIFQTVDLIVANVGPADVREYSFPLHTGNATNLDIGANPLYGINTTTNSTSTRWTIQAARTAGSSTNGSYSIRRVSFVLRRAL